MYIHSMVYLPVITVFASLCLSNLACMYKLKFLCEHLRALNALMQGSHKFFTNLLRHAQVHEFNSKLAC